MGGVGLYERADKLVQRLRTESGVDAERGLDRSIGDVYVNVWNDPHARYPTDTIWQRANRVWLWGPDYEHVGIEDDVVRFFTPTQKEQ